MVAFAIITTISVLYHEAGHIMASRALKIPVKMEFSRRNLIMLVLHTDMTNVRSLHRKQRYIPYLAGILFDSMSIFICLIIELSDRGNLSDQNTMLILCKEWVLVKVLGFVFQAMLFSRTDLYYVMCNLLGCSNLISDTRLYLLHGIFGRLKFLRDRVFQESPLWNLRERRVLRLYSLLFVVGIGSLLFSMVRYGVPSAMYAIMHILAQMKSSNIEVKGSGILAGLLIVIPYAILGYSYVRDYVKRRNIRKNSTKVQIEHELNY